MSEKSEITLLQPFETARKHAEQTKRGISLLLSAPVALGAELLRLKAEVDPKKGRPKKRATGELPISTDLPWKELVAEQTGFSWEWCRRSMVAAERVIVRLSESKDSTDKAAAKLLQNPPPEWTEEDYQGLSGKIGAVYDAQTFTELLIELKVLRDPAEKLGGGKPAALDDKKKKKTTPSVEARDYFRSFRQGLAADRDNLALYRKRLRYLEIASEDPEEICLADLKVELATHVELVDAEINRREKKK